MLKKIGVIIIHIKDQGQKVIKEILIETLIILRKTQSYLLQIFKLLK